MTESPVDAAAREGVIRRYSERYPENDTAFLLRLLDADRARADRAQAASEGVDMLIAQAERRGAVKALREAAREAAGAWNVKPYVDAWLTKCADAIENGADL